MSKQISGLITALVTPFKNQKIDYNSFTRLVEFQISKGIEGFVVNGTTGESPCLDPSEVKELFKITKRICGDKVPVILGTGSNSTEDTIRMTQEALEWGADAALVVVPYYNKPPQRGICAHFRKIAESCDDLPIILYNVPGRTVVSMSQETIADLSNVKNIIGIKEASGDMDFAQDILKNCNSDFTILSGDDSSCMAMMEAGGEGVISVISHIIPKAMRELCDRARERNGDMQPCSGYEKFRKLDQLLGVEANPIPVKMALQLLGIIDSAEMRLPLVTLSEEYTEQLKNCLKDLEMI